MESCFTTVGFGFRGEGEDVDKIIGLKRRLVRAYFATQISSLSFGAYIKYFANYCVYLICGLIKSCPTNLWFSILRRWLVFLFILRNETVVSEKNPQTLSLPSQYLTGYCFTYLMAHSRAINSVLINDSLKSE